MFHSHDIRPFYTSQFIIKNTFFTHFDMRENLSLSITHFLLLIFVTKNLSTAYEAHSLKTIIWQKLVVFVSCYRHTSVFFFYNNDNKNDNMKEKKMIILHLFPSLIACFPIQLFDISIKISNYRISKKNILNAYLIMKKKCIYDRKIKDNDDVVV